MKTEDTLVACVISFITAFFLACQLMQSINVAPLEREALKRGYAYYATTNTNEPSITVFTWKSYAKD